LQLLHLLYGMVMTEHMPRYTVRKGPSQTVHTYFAVVPIQHFLHQFPAPSSI
jgi:hypothetical protein